ncbi:phage baseplate assembly protein V [Kingella kingae]|uniref:phage baseplate assembly protein V n=2 Tax=Kingella kingae TaxID=504 RepID=UPI0003F6E058|nr:phage baseplate assembly protein V [Kingella kingae]
MSLVKMVKQSKATAQAVSDGIRQAFRGKLKLTQSSEPIQRTQVAGLDGETLQDVEQLQQFGFTSHAPADSDVIVVPLGGDTSHGIVIACEHGDLRVKQLQSGEVAIYDQAGSSIVLKQGKIIEIVCDTLNINASQKVQINSPLVETSQVLTAQGQINGNGGMAIAGGSGATVSGSLHTTGDVTAGGVSLQGHIHSGDSGGTTGAAQYSELNLD